MRNGKALELDWTPVEFVIGSAYLWVPVVAAGILLTRKGTRGR
jgi:alpha-1,2-mannosyltransferase